MPAHLIAFTESQAAAAALDQVSALTDPLISIRNNSFILQRDANLRWGWVGSASLTRARLVTPSFRQVTNTEVRPWDLSATPTDDPNLVDWRRSPPLIKAQEEFELQTSNNAGVAVRVTGIFLLDMGVQTAPAGQSWWLRGASTTAAVANAWTTITATWDDDLPAGNWIVTGLEVQSAGAQAARLIFDDQPYWPGTLSITALGNRNHPMFTEGDYILGKFNSWRMPEIQVLCNSADAAHEIYLRIQRG